MTYEEVEEAKKRAKSKSLTLAQAKRDILGLLERIGSLEDDIFSLQENIDDLESHIDDLENQISGMKDSF
jgi:predicted  nucleic acid-binding Zn-ribbon protein